MAINAQPRKTNAPAPPARPAPQARTAAPAARPAPPQRTALNAAPRIGARQAQNTVPAVAVVSLAPRDATMGGLIDDVNATIIDCGFFLTDYNGASDVSSPALIVQLQPEAVEGADPLPEFEQIYSAGSADKFVPNGNNTGLTPVGNQTGINNSTNCFKFLTSMVECGFPEDVLAAGNIKAIIGTYGHVKRIAQPKRTGLIRTRGGEDDNREKTTLIFDAIMQLPDGIGEGGVVVPTSAGAATPQRRATAAAGNARPAAPASPSSRAAVGGKPNGAARAVPQPLAETSPAPDEDLDTLVFTCLQEALQPNEQTEKRSLSPTLFPLLSEKVKAKEMDTKTKTAVIQRANSEEFLNSLVEQGLAEYDGATLTLLG